MAAAQDNKTTKI